MARICRFVESFSHSNPTTTTVCLERRCIILSLPSYPPLTSLEGALRVDGYLVGKFRDKLVCAFAKNPAGIYE